MAMELGKAFAKLLTPKTMRNLKEASIAIERTVNGSTLQELLGIFKSFGVNLQPLAVPFQMFLSQIEAGTIEQVIGLSTTLIELLQDPKVRENMGMLIEDINTLFEVIGSLATSSFLRNVIDNIRAAKNMIYDLTSALIGVIEELRAAKQKEEELRARVAEGENLSSDEYYDWTGTGEGGHNVQADPFLLD